MKVADLKKALEGVSDDLEVVVTGHFGEGLEADASDLRVKEKVRVVRYWWKDEGEEQTVFVLPYVDRGPEPD